MGVATRTLIVSGGLFITLAFRVPDRCSGEPLQP